MRSCLSGYFVVLNSIFGVTGSLELLVGINMLQSRMPTTVLYCTVHQALCEAVTVGSWA